MTRASQADWRDDLRIASWPVRDQGTTDICVLFALTALHELARYDTSFEALSEHSLSPGLLNPPGGFPLSDASETLIRHGQLSRADWDDMAPEQRPHARQLRHLSWMKARMARIDPSPGTIGSHLGRGSAVLLGLQLTRSLRKPDSQGIVRAAADDEVIPLRHAVSVVGSLDIDDELYFLIRNSWGEKWGLQGYGYLHSEYIATYGKAAAIISKTLN